MKKAFTLSALLGSVLCFGQPVPEVLYYRFDGSGTIVPNLALNPPPNIDTAVIVGTGHSQGSTGQCGGALVGTGAVSSTNYVNTNWAPNLGNGSWTISFWTSNIVPSVTLWYILGDVNTGSLRCFTNGVAGPNNWILRGAGLTDVLISGGATMAPHMNTFVYDNTLNNVRAYLDGNLVNTVAQGAPNLTGIGPFKVGAYSSSSSLNGLMDEFRIYNRALSPAEIMQLYNRNTNVTISVTACGSYTVPSGDETYTTSGTYMDTIPRVYCGDSLLTINLTINTPPTVSLGNDITQCGGTVTLNAGNPGSTYLWSNSATTQTITVNASGTYSVVVTDANGCTGTDAINITINPPPAVSLGNDITQCGGTVTLNAGNPGSTYLWSNSATTQTITVSNGTYSVVVTDVNGCTGTDTINITINVPPTVSLGNDTTQCAGTVMLDAGNPGSTYLWNNASTTQTITVSSSGAYSVIVTDVNGCTGTDTLNVTINPLPAVIYNETQTLVCVTWPPITLTAGTPPGGTYSGTAVTGNTFDPSVAGQGTFNIIYTYTDSNGCTNSDTSAITVDMCTGISQANGLLAAMYPNPAQSELHIEANADAFLEIADVSGRIVVARQLKKGKNAINVSQFSNGMYQVILKSETGTLVRKLVVSK
jgi:hypothetical protein